MDEIIVETEQPVVEEPVVEVLPVAGDVEPVVGGEVVDGALPEDGASVDAPAVVQDQEAVV